MVFLLVMRPILLLLTASVLSSCAVAESNVCTEAADFLHSCLELPSAYTEIGACNKAHAQRVLESSCEELSRQTGKSDGTSDWLNSIACSAGFLRFCPLPACEEELASPLECSAHLQSSGCASCEYYACRAAQTSCGPNGYFSRRGYRYCERLTQVAGPRLSPAGQVWLSEARQCLMEFAEANIPVGASCGQIADLGYGSHPDCYEGAGFCDLPASDWLTILSTIDPDDLRLSEVLATGMRCLRTL